MRLPHTTPAARKAELADRGAELALLNAELGGLGAELAHLNAELGERDPRALARLATGLP